MDCLIRARRKAQRFTRAITFTFNDSLEVRHERYSHLKEEEGAQDSENSRLGWCRDSNRTCLTGGSQLSNPLLKVSGKFFFLYDNILLTWKRPQKLYKSHRTLTPDSENIKDIEDPGLSLIGVYLWWPWPMALCIDEHLLLTIISHSPIRLFTVKPAFVLNKLIKTTFG